MTELAFLTRENRPDIAFVHRKAARDGGTTLMFMPGYGSDMDGTKALALDEWARQNGHGCVRFDYAACGQSKGDFEAQSLTDWLGDAMAVLDHCVPDGAVTLVGSSMGGWIMLLMALELKKRGQLARIKALIGIASAPDFTAWGFTVPEVEELMSNGRLERMTPYGPEPQIFSRAFWQSGEYHRLLHVPIELDCPVRLLHGQADTSVPWEYSIEIGRKLTGDNVETYLVKNGDHRLSRESDIAKLIQIASDNM